MPQTREVPSICFRCQCYHLLHCTAAFNDQHDIQNIANSGDFSNQSNIATEKSMGEQMVAYLDNLTNAAVQKNDKVEKLFMSNKPSLISLLDRSKTFWSS